MRLTVVETVTRYHIMYVPPLIRTSMALDQGTLDALAWLAKRWAVSKAEVMRRAIKQARKEAEAEDNRPSPLKALEHLQKGGGLDSKVAEEFRAEVAAEREAARYWWDS